MDDPDPDFVFIDDLDDAPYPTSEEMARIMDWIDTQISAGVIRIVSFTTDRIGILKP